MDVAFELTGVTPLLMHNDDIEAADLLNGWRKDPANNDVSKKGDDRSPGWTWQTYLYSDGEHVGIPSGNLMVNLRTAATKVPLPDGKNGKTCKEISQSGMVVRDEFLAFTFNGKQRLKIADVLKLREKPFAEQAAWAAKEGFRLFAKRARVGQSKHVRVRPRFETWSVRGVLAVTAPAITFELVEEFFEYGGRGGLCDWRPSSPKSPGPFGMYETKLKEI